MSVLEVPLRRFESADGLSLAYRELGEGRPLILLHGYLSTATDTWFRHGHAARIATGGYRVITPDFRGHGSSAKPRDHLAYPADALVDDGFALITHLGLVDYDLGGYSLGGRIVARMLARGATPTRAIVGGTGLEPIVHAAGRGSRYREILANFGTFAPGSIEWQIEQSVTQVGGDPVALANVLNTLVDTPREALARAAVPTLVVAGVEDDQRGSAQSLAALLPHGRYAPVPGDHFSALTRPELAVAIVDFLGPPT